MKVLTSSKNDPRLLNDSCTVGFLSSLFFIETPKEMFAFPGDVFLLHGNEWVVNLKNDQTITIKLIHT